MSKKYITFALAFRHELKTMIYRSVHMIFETSGMPVPTEEEVQFEALELLQRSGWGLPLIERLRKIADPYWREAIARWLMERWRELVRDKDEQTYYYDMDGAIRYCWEDADYDFGRIIRASTNEQAEAEYKKPNPTPSQKGRECDTVQAISKKEQPRKVVYIIQTHNGPIITDSHVDIHQ